MLVMGTFYDEGNLNNPAQLPYQPAIGYSKCDAATLRQA
jgi:hypothetical protein